MKQILIGAAVLAALAAPSAMAQNAATAYPNKAVRMVVPFPPGGGNDILTGGAGADTFRFWSSDSSRTASDRITDFTQGEDVIDLHLLSGTLGLSKSGAAGTVFHHHAFGQTIVEAHLDSDGLADLRIAMDGLFKLGVDDFLL